MSKNGPMEYLKMHRNELGSKISKLVFEKSPQVGLKIK